MAWQDDPVVSAAQPAWTNDPIAGQPASTPQDPGFVANAARALRMGLPFGNQFVAAEKTVLPQALGGSRGFDYGQNLTDVNAADARLQQEHPTIADLGQGTGAAIGALAVPAAALGEGAQGLGTIGRVVRGGLTGAGLGAVQGVGAPGSDIRNLPQTEQGAIGGGYTGLALGAGFPAIGLGIGKVVSPLADALRGGSTASVDASMPTIDTIKSMKKAAYDAADQLGVAYQPKAIQDLANKITSDAQAEHINPLVHPKSVGTLDTINSAAASNQPMTLTQLDQLRQVVGRDLGKGSGDAERFFGNQIRGNIDNFIATAEPDAMASGVGPEAADAIQNARKLNTINAKVEALKDQLEHAKDLAGSSGSGANLDNSMRQAIRRFQDSHGNLTPDEAALAQQGIRGTTLQNRLRQVGKLAPTGLVGGLEALSSVGAGLTSGIPGAAIPAAIAGTGQVAKFAADRMTKNNADALVQAILAGGKASNAGPTPAALLATQSPSAPVSRAAMAAALAANANLQARRNQATQP